MKFHKPKIILNFCTLRCCENLIILFWTYFVQNSQTLILGYPFPLELCKSKTKNFLFALFFTLCPQFAINSIFGFYNKNILSQEIILWVSVRSFSTLIMLKVHLLSIKFPGILAYNEIYIKSNRTKFFQTHESLFLLDSNKQKIYIHLVSDVYPRIVKTIYLKYLKKVCKISDQICLQRNPI